MKRCCVMILLAWVLLTGTGYSATFMVLWSHVTTSKGGESWWYEDSFNTIEACKKAVTSKLETKLINLLIDKDGQRWHPNTNPLGLKKIFTDGVLERDAMGLVPMNPLPTTDANWYGYWKWIKEPSEVSIERNDGMLFYYEWTCVPDTVDPRPRKGTE